MAVTEGKEERRERRTGEKERKREGGREVEERTGVGERGRKNISHLLSPLVDGFCVLTWMCSFSKYMVHSRKCIVRIVLKK